MTKFRVAIATFALATVAGAGIAAACPPPDGTTTTTSVARAAAQRPAPPAPRGGAARPATPGTTATPAATVPVVANGTVAVVFSGGFTYGADDHGRPVNLYDGALGLPAGTYRRAFAGVTPAHGGGPSEAEAQANKQALMSVLAPFGVTNDRLDQVANRYRFQPQSGQVWTHQVASATATVVDGTVTKVTITNPGHGYNVAPTVTVNGRKATATLGWSNDFGQNGRITAITLG